MSAAEKKLNCLVLGANGFLGANLCKGLLSSGHRVRTFSRQPFRADLVTEGPALEHYVGDFCDRADLKRALEGVDIVFHLISTTLPQSSNKDPVFDVESNIGGTVALLEAMRESDVNKILFVSSGGTVYGATDSAAIHEGMPTNPICSYGIGKIAIEKYLFMYQELYGLEYFVFRLSNPYGIGRKMGKQQGAINSFLANALQGNAIEVWGDGSVIRDYIYIDDVVDACVRVVSVKKWSGEVLNIGSGQGASLIDIVTVIGEVIGMEVKCSFQASRSFDVPVNVLDITRAGRVLSWSPKVSLSQGVEITRQWLIATL